MNKKTIIFIIFLIIFSSLCYAQETSGSASFSDGDDDGYDDNTGLDKNGYANPDMPIPTTTKNFKLKSGTYNTADGTTIAVSDDTTVNRNSDGTYSIGGNDIGGKNIEYSGGTYKIIGEGSVNGVSISNGQGITVSKSRAISGTASKDCNVNGIGLEEGSKFFYDPNKKEIVTQDAKITKIGNNFEGTINTNGKETELPDGTRVNGKLSYKDGQAYIKAGDTVTIDGVKIKAREETSGYKGGISVFFDGNQHSKVDGDYVSINRENKKVYLSSKSYRPVELEFQENNPFLRIKKGNDVSLIEINNIEFSIQNRDDIGLIPEIIISRFNGRKSSDFRLDSGGASISGHDRVTSTQIYGDQSMGLSSPMSITVNDENGNTLLGTVDNPKKILISSYNELIIIPDAQTNPEKKIEKSRIIEIYQYYHERKKVVAHFDSENNLIGYSTDDEPNKLVDINGNKIGSIKDKEVKYDVLALEGWTETSYEYDFAPGKVSERLYFNNMPPEVFEGEDLLIKNNLGVSELFDMIAEEDRIIIYGRYDSATLKKISDSLKRMPPRIKDSIGAYRINERGGITSGGVYPGYQEGGKIVHVNKYNYDEGTLLHEGAHALTMQLDGEDGKDSPFYSKWISVAGNVYTRDDADFKERGCITPYGCSNPDGFEDITTYSQFVYSNPSRYNDYIDTNNNDKRPIKKLSLLNEGGFLPKGWLSNKMKEVGYSEDCVSKVTGKDGYLADCIN